MDRSGFKNLIVENKDKLFPQHPNKKTALYPAVAPACPARFPVPPARSPWATAPWGCGRPPVTSSNRAPWCYRCEPSTGDGALYHQHFFYGVRIDPDAQTRKVGRAQGWSGFRTMPPYCRSAMPRARPGPRRCPGRPHTRTWQATASVVRTDCGRSSPAVRVLVPRHLVVQRGSGEQVDVGIVVQIRGIGKKQNLLG